MNIDELKARLDELDKNTLQDFVLDLYLNYPELSDTIESLVLANDPSALTKVINKRIQSIKRGRRFIDYHASFSFARDLETIISDIERGLLDSSPKHAFELTDKFLATAENVINRVDDSAGVVGDVYRTAVLQWLLAAKSWGNEATDWVDSVYKLCQDTDDGVLDPLLPHSNILLTEEQLKQLAWRYESETRKAMKGKGDNNKTNWEAIKGSVALGSVAEALQDPALYERSVLIHRPQPNDMQKQDIIKMYLKFNRTEDALRWLNTSWEKHFERDRQRLLEAAYEQNGDKEQLVHIRRQLYLGDQSYTSLEHYLELLDDDEKKVVKEQAIKEAEKGRNVSVSADLLLQLGENESAQSLVVSRDTELAEMYYENLRNLAKKLEKAHLLLAATACYRALLSDILNSGRSKAYTHAARYYKKLQSMAEGIQQFSPLPSHEKFMEQLEKNHYRKYSFWDRVK
ncbi:MAG: hypothetical protein EP297_11210 [Gammaproteobacteria bacterium]|nr:MAG: hypothetical protein EP297_11210 [Gammaproteobacteria bacterium]